jgi:hypothetical protein
MGFAPTIDSAGRIRWPARGLSRDIHRKYTTGFRGVMFFYCSIFAVPQMQTEKLTQP